MNNEPVENKEPVEEKKENPPMENPPDPKLKVDGVVPEDRPLMREDLMIVFRELLRMNGMDGRNGHENGEELSPDQKKIKEDAQAFRDAVKGPEGLREYERQPPAGLDEYGNVIPVPAKPEAAA
jgi:hypothetical protein